MHAIPTATALLLDDYPPLAELIRNA